MKSQLEMKEELDKIAKGIDDNHLRVTKLQTIISNAQKEQDTKIAEYCEKEFNSELEVVRTNGLIQTRLTYLFNKYFVKLSSKRKIIHLPMMDNRGTIPIALSNSGFGIQGRYDKYKYLPSNVGYWTSDKFLTYISIINHGTKVRKQIHREDKKDLLKLAQKCLSKVGTENLIEEIRRVGNNPDNITLIDNIDEEINFIYRQYSWKKNFEFIKMRVNKVQLNFNKNQVNLLLRDRADGYNRTFELTRHADIGRSLMLKGIKESPTIYKQIKELNIITNKILYLDNLKKI